MRQRDILLMHHCTLTRQETRRQTLPDITRHYQTLSDMDGVLLVTRRHTVYCSQCMRGNIFHCQHNNSYALTSHSPAITLQHSTATAQVRPVIVQEKITTKHKIQWKKDSDFYKSTTNTSQYFPPKNQLINFIINYHIIIEWIVKMLCIILKQLSRSGIVWVTL